MKRGFKSALATLGLVLSVSTIQAQTAEKSVFDNLSVEAQYGYNSAMSPKNDIVTSDYSGFNFFQLGLTYHIDDVWGVRGTFASSNFKNDDAKKYGVKYNRLMLEGTYNVLTSIKGLMQPFDITAHAGLGLASGNSETVSGNDIAGVVQVGIMPKYNFSSQFAVFVDATLVNQFSQDFGYNGLSVKQGSGSYLNIGLGIQCRFNK